MGGSLHGKLRLSGTLTALTALCIGIDGQQSKYTPRNVVRHPVSLAPYIPGSSLRGAVRHILSIQPLDSMENKAIEQIFGSPRTAVTNRLSGCAVFRDAFMSSETINSISTIDHRGYLAEFQMCAHMDRITSQHEAYALERVPGGSYFDFEILYSIHSPQDFQSFQALLTGLHLLEFSSLGSHGSRGLGKMKFGRWSTTTDSAEENGPIIETGLELSWRSCDYYQKGAAENLLVKADEKLGPAEILGKSETFADSIGL